MQIGNNTIIDYAIAILAGALLGKPAEEPPARYDDSVYKAARQLVGICNELEAEYDDIMEREQRRWHERHPPR
jgi:hypothetical protein